MDRASEPWYLVQLRPNQYARARRNLERQGYACFMPMRDVTERRRGRLIAAQRPLFPGYLFLEVPPDQQFWRSINGTYGVSRLVSLSGEGPTRVPPALMDALFARCEEELWRPVTETFVPGMSVRLIAGPFAQTVATIDTLAAADRVYVLLEMMGQTVRAAVEKRHLERAEV